MNSSFAPTVQIAVIGLLGTIVTALGVVLASRFRAGRNDPLVTIAGELGNVRARVDEHERRIQRIEDGRRHS